MSGVVSVGVAVDAAAFAASMSPISFRVAAKFEAAAGAGSRLGVRTCKFTFNKH